MAEVKVMSNLATLDGISEARQRLYNQLENGDITESRAATQERLLRGQTDLKATVPLRLIAIIAKSKNPGVAKYGEPLMRRIVSFTAGDAALAQIDADNSEQ